LAAIGVDFYHQHDASLKSAGALAVFDDYQLVADYLKLPKL
jgi:phosphoglycolate phosphatase